jgi:hypothetical protein
MGRGARRECGTLSVAARASKRVPIFVSTPVYRGSARHAPLCGSEGPARAEAHPPNRLIPSDRGFAPRESMRAISLSVTHPDLPDGLIQGFRFMRAFYVNGAAGTRSFTRGVLAAAGRMLRARLVTPPGIGWSRREGGLLHPNLHNFAQIPN